MANWVNGNIIAIEYWTDTLFGLKLHAPILPFIAGQFAKLSLSINGEKIQRAYSYVNAPDDELLEFYLYEVPTGKLSPYLSRLKVGDSIQVTEKAAGFFVLDEIPDCDTLWMVATGTAIGPYLSILQYGHGLERFNHIVLIHAVRYAADLNYLPVMKALQEHYPDKLRIQAIVSREHANGCLHGRIPALIDSGELEQTTGLSISQEQSHIMLCGNPSMVADTQEYLIKHHNMHKHLRRKPGHVTSELYW